MNLLCCSRNSHAIQASNILTASANAEAVFVGYFQIFSSLRYAFVSFDIL